MIRKLFLFVLFLPFTQVSNAQYVNLHLVDTTTQSYALADVRSIMYNQDQMQMTFIGGNALYWNTSFINYMDYDDLNLGIQRPSTELEDDFSVYPNPSNAFVNIKVNTDFEAEVELVISNLQGQIVKTLFEGELNSKSTELRWDGDNANGLRVTPGTYICTLFSQKQRVSRIIILTDQ